MTKGIGRWLAGSLVVLACSPEYEVYPPADCTADADCGAYSACLVGTCEPCDVLYELCDVACPGMWQLTGERRGDCPTCACAQGGSGGEAATGGRAGLSTTTGGAAALAGAGGTLGLACQDHSACSPGLYCDGVCLDCVAVPPPCPDCVSPEQATPVQLNGCDLCVCAAPNECFLDSDCASGRCLPGAVCSDGCTEAACCFGNTCLL